jgi:hypothetical protein
MLKIGSGGRVWGDRELNKWFSLSLVEEKEVTVLTVLLWAC